VGLSYRFSANGFNRIALGCAAARRVETMDERIQEQRYVQPGRQNASITKRR